MLSGGRPEPGRDREYVKCGLASRHACLRRMSPALAWPAASEQVIEGKTGPWVVFTVLKQRGTPGTKGMAGQGEVFFLWCPFRIPACREGTVNRLEDTHFRAELSLGLWVILRDTD